MKAKQHMIEYNFNNCALAKRWATLRLLCGGRTLEKQKSREADIKLKSGMDEQTRVHSRRGGCLESILYMLHDEQFAVVTTF